MRFISISLAVSLLHLPSPATAAPETSAYAGSRHEVALMTGNLPTEEYYTAIPISVAYTFNLSQSLGWNVVDFSHVINRRNKLNNNLTNTALALGMIAPMAFPKTTQLLASRLALRVRYDDFLPGVTSLEARLLIGPAMVVREFYKEKMHFGGDVTVGARVGLTPTTSLVFDVGETVYVVPTGNNNEIEDIFRMRFGLAVTL